MKNLKNTLLFKKLYDIILVKGNDIMENEMNYTNNTNDNKQKRKKIIIIIAIIVAIILLITWILVICLNNNTPSTPDLGLTDPVGDINAPVIDSETEGRNLQNEILELNKLYPDAIAWLKVPGTVVDTPVFQSVNNDRYLRHDRDNVKTKWGETFMDYRCNIDNMSDKSHFIIYGHNTETNDHFTPLLNYKKEDFFKEHQIIEMSTINGNYKWQIFSVYVTDINFFYIDTNFVDINEYATFLSTLKSKSMYNTNTDVNSSDTILTLSTCDYSRKDGRFVVQAKLVKE